MKNKLTTLLVLGTLMIGCQPNENPENPTGPSVTDDAGFSQKVVYGEDDRIDVFEIIDPVWRQMASSTVALMDSSRLTKNSDGFDIRTESYADRYGLCTSEPFYEQSTAAFCSGSLIGDDIIVTAGHCISTTRDCSTTKFVFGFAYENKNEAPESAKADDVYSCKEIIHSEVDRFSGSDFALIRLDRKVVGREPLEVRDSGTVGDNSRLTVIGHPAGLPTKLADGAQVRNNLNADFIVANLDTYGGNSGSAVFNSRTKRVEGILVRGETDYTYSGGCRLSNVCDDDGCRGEDVTRIGKIFDHVSVDDLTSSPEEPSESFEP